MLVGAVLISIVLMGMALTLAAWPVATRLRLRPLLMIVPLNAPQTLVKQHLDCERS